VRPRASSRLITMSGISSKRREERKPMPPLTGLGTERSRHGCYKDGAPTGLGAECGRHGYYKDGVPRELGKDFSRACSCTKIAPQWKVANS